MLTILALYLVILFTMVYGPIAAFPRRAFPGADSLQLRWR
jgi:hypothetical protein